MLKGINKDHFRVAIFGSARIKQDDPLYRQIMDLAKMIAEEGMDIVTGGGPGLMDAACAGHKLGRKGNNTHAIGLTITLPHEQHDSAHLDIKENFEKFTGRLDNFMELSHAVVVAPGGVGTLLEFVYTWQLIQVKMKSDIPIIMLGEEWPGLIEWVKEHPLKTKYLNKEDLKYIYLAEDNKEALDILRKAHKRFDEGKQITRLRKHRAV